MHPSKSFAELNLFQTIGSSWNSPSGFSQLNCPASFSTSCQLTANRTLLADTSQFDAVVFHERDFRWKDVPDKERRKRSQAYVFTSYEAPVWGNRRKEKMQRMKGFFNWSMTYRMDSTFYTPYGGFVKTRDHPLGSKLRDIAKEFGERNQAIARKTKSAAGIVQIVSNCKSQSKREKLLKSMQKLIRVDIYGSCGPLKCPRSGAGGDAGWKCYQMLERRYKFYLAWENALCKDYVTEKFFEITKYNIIPVVLNRAAMDQIAPRHSYIALEDFKSMSHLVKYLQKVDKDDKLFTSYFWWRDFYSVQDHHISRHKSWCSLCSTLHKDEWTDWNKEHLTHAYAGHQENDTIGDLNNFWVKQANCKLFSNRKH